MIVVDRTGNIVTKGESQNNLLKKLYGTFLGRCALKILVCKFVTNLGGWYMNSGFSRRKISSFIKENAIDMREYENREFRSYNDFFTRKIVEGKRPFSKDENILISPADSKLSYYKIQEDSVFTIKDRSYTLTDLVDNAKLASKYQGGLCLIFRLTVDDYHRYSFIDDGKVIKRKYIKGIFHTVNPIANDYYPIYARNAREYSIIETKNFGTIVQMEVGAMMVGKIVNHDIVDCKRGQEKGKFEFGGSTVVLLFEKDKVCIDQDIIDNSLHDKETVVKLGEKIGIKNGI